MHAHMIISGRVQGVGFRFSAKQKATELGLTGWVRNLDDGNVEIEVEGNEKGVNDFIVALKKGFHPFIRVEHVELTAAETEKGYTSFEIK